MWSNARVWPSGTAEAEKAGPGGWPEMPLVPTSQGIPDLRLFLGEVHSPNWGSLSVESALVWPRHPCQSGVRDRRHVLAAQATTAVALFSWRWFSGCRVLNPMRQLSIEERQEHFGAGG